MSDYGVHEGHCGIDPYDGSKEEYPSCKYGHDILPHLICPVVSGLTKEVYDRAIAKLKIEKAVEENKKPVPMEVKKKPTRKDFLKILGELQRLIGKAKGLHANDRNPMGFEYGQNALEEAHELCISASQFDPPVETPEGL